MWYVVCGMWYVVCSLWYVALRKEHVVCGMWHELVVGTTRTAHYMQYLLCVHVLCAELHADRVTQVCTAYGALLMAYHAFLTKCWILHTMCYYQLPNTCNVLPAAHYLPSSLHNSY